MTSEKFWDFFTPPLPLFRISRNLSVLFVRKIGQFLNPPSVRMSYVHGPKGEEIISALKSQLKPQNTTACTICPVRMNFLAPAPSREDGSGIFTHECISPFSYRVAHLLADLGLVDSDLRSSQAGGPLLQLSTAQAG